LGVARQNILVVLSLLNTEKYFLSQRRKPRSDIARIEIFVGKDPLASTLILKSV
jgi:hypothetical protein